MRVEKTMGCGNGVWEKPKDGEKDINLKKKKRKKATQSGVGNNLSPLPPGRINEKKICSSQCISHHVSKKGSSVLHDFIQTLRSYF